MMIKYIITILLLVLVGVPTYASEVTGTITTGVNTGVEGIVVVSPSASPVAGSYTSTQNVVLVGGDGTNSIHYTTDGSVATCSSGSEYSSPIEVSSSLVIEAVSCYANNVVSPTAIFGYAIDIPPAPTPSPAPSGGGGGGGGGGIITNPFNEPYDFNSDGKVDVFDFNILMTNWGRVSGASKSEGDADGDGDVDIFDFNLLITNWQS